VKNQSWCLLPNCACVGQCGKLGKPSEQREYEAMRRSSSLTDYDGKPCPYCGDTMQTDSETKYPSRDHIIPRSRGGTDADRNLIIVCNACNYAKGDATLEQWHSHLVRVSDLRARNVLRIYQSPRGEGT